MISSVHPSHNFRMDPKNPPRNSVELCQAIATQRAYREAMEEATRQSRGLQPINSAPLPTQTNPIVVHTVEEKGVQTSVDHKLELKIPSTPQKAKKRYGTPHPAEDIIPTNLRPFFNEL